MYSVSTGSFVLMCLLVSTGCLSQLFVCLSVLLVENERLFCLLDNPIQVKSEKLEKEAKSWE